MHSTLCLLTCALAIGQAPQWQLQPQLTRGQELVYSGTFSEEALGELGQFQRTYKVETRILVLDAAAKKFDLAFLTTVATKLPLANQNSESGPATESSARLEVLALDRQGKLLTKIAGNLIPPLQGPPTIECGFFAEVPQGRVGKDAKWEVNEEGRPPRTWQVDAPEMINNVLCVKLIGIQQSEDWNSPRADSSSWQRRDTIWISPQLALPSRYEREIQRRDPARRSPTHRSVLRCDLEGGSTFPGKLFEDRRREIEQARKFSAEISPWLREPLQHKASLQSLLQKVKHYIDTEPATPYRKAIVQVQRRGEAALRGESIPDPGAEEALPSAARSTVGQRVPDFICTDLLNNQTLRLQSVVGKPVVVMFFSPVTETGRHALRLGKTLSQRFPQGVTVLAMAVTDDVEGARRLHRELNLPFSMLDGKGLMPLFGVDALPKLVILDGQGVVRASWTGWGQHTQPEVLTQLQKLLQ